MGWVKQGVPFVADGRRPWMAQRTQVPIPVLLGDDRLRIYFSPRDEQGRAHPAYADVRPDAPATVLHLSERPLLALGRPGTFDDCGVMPGSVVQAGDETRLYYTGWATGGSVPYRNAIGLATSHDGGETFVRVHEAPVLDRDAGSPFGPLGPFVLRDGAQWRMWHAAVTHWEHTADRYEAVYDIRHSVSTDGVTWEGQQVCIPARSPQEALGRPWVVRDGDRYRMWFSYRATTGFREHRDRSYRIGYAESPDGLSWRRCDDGAGIGPSPTGWDADMVAYAAVYEHGGRRHMLYNGNGFGATGIGHAVEAG